MGSPATRGEPVPLTQMVAAPPRPAETTTLQKLFRYGAVSLVATPIGLGLLTLFHNGFGWNASLSNFLAVSISSIPSYSLNRRWVWKQDGEVSMRHEVLPFWLMALLGLAVSTIFVAWVETNYDFPLAAQLANLASFGVLWIVKFFILDRWLFIDRSENQE